MSENKPIRLFLSCVSDEFHKPDPAGRRPFLSYRDHLAQSFRKARVEIIVQEDFAQSFGDLLQTLDEEVARCHVVVHLVGDMAGASPTPDEVRRLRERHPDLFAQEPTLRARLDDPLPIAYTQWELYLTYQHHGRPLVFLAAPDTVRSPCHRKEQIQLDSQARHRQTITDLGKHRDTFLDQDKLAMKVFIALTRHGILTAKVPGTIVHNALEAARNAITAILEAIRGLIKNPDPRAVPAGASSDVDVLSHAYQTVAQARGLTPQDLVQLLDEHQANARAAVEAQRTPEALCELALTQMALGDYEQAMCMATEAAQLAGHAFNDGAPDAEPRRQSALKAWALAADVARAARHPGQAAAAQEQGGRLIDRERESLFWADYHQSLAELLLHLARYDEAERYARAIIAIREEHLGDDQLKLADALLVLGKLLWARANYFGVEVVARRILRILQGHASEAALGVHGAALSLLGLAFTDEGRFDEAEAPLRQALAIDERIYAPEDPNLATALNNLALLLLATSRLVEAEPLLRRALAIDERSCGREHPNVARDLNNLARLLYDTNRLVEAEPLVRRALTIRERSLGGEHPYVAQSLSSLGAVLLTTKRLAEAEPLLRRALAIDEQSCGPQHPNFAEHLHNLALLLGATNRLVEAEPLMRQALAIDEMSFGPEHPSVASDLNSLAHLLRAANRLAEAEPLMRRAVEIREMSLVPDHPWTKVSKESLAIIQAALRKQQQ
jgi:tetratricopeptide (TPR) repeat protein